MSHFIDLQTAIEMTSRYRSEKENILEPQYRQRNILPVCETFSRDTFDTLLNEGQPGQVKKVRIYFSMNRDLQLRAIIVGVDDQDKDILPPSGGSLNVGGSGEVIIENGQLCPPICPPASPLNS